MHRTKMQQEIGAFFVRHLAVCVIWVLALLEGNDQPLVLRCRLVGLEIVVESFRANDVLEASGGRRVELLLQHTFHVRRKAFIEPEMTAVCLSMV